MSPRKAPGKAQRRDPRPQPEPPSKDEASGTAASGPDPADPMTLLGLPDELAGHPATAALLGAYDAFARGDYATTRARLAALRQGHPAMPEALSGATDSIERAMGLDTPTLIFAAASALFFIGILVLVY